MQELLDAQTSSDAKLLVRELLVDVRAWRLKVTEIFQADRRASQLRLRMSCVRGLRRDSNGWNGE